MKHTATQIVKILKDVGYKAVFAGGCVRDLIMRTTPNDYDIATDATPDDIERIFEKTVSVGKSFGVIVVIMNDMEFEVATFRNDGEYSDGRRPDSVVFSSMEEDAKRRDFTINGLFFDPIEDKMIDLVDGVNDIENGVIRFIGDPDARISEDRLRMLRAIRFKNRFGFKIDQKSFEAIQRHGHTILDISWERIRDEIVKMLDSSPRAMIEDLREAGLLKHILPEIEAMSGCEQPTKWHPEGDVLEHTIRAMEVMAGETIEMRLAAMLHDVGKPTALAENGDGHFSHHAKIGAKMAREILERLRFSSKTVEHIGELVYYHMKPQVSMEMRVSRLKRLLGLEFIEDLLLLHKADSLGSNGDLTTYNFIRGKLEDFTPEEIKPEPLINGRDLIEMGFEPSPIFGEVLGKIYDRQLEEPGLDRETALAEAREMIIHLFGEK